jgi:antirestriction protein ArdC
MALRMRATQWKLHECIPNFRSVKSNTGASVLRLGGDKVAYRPAMPDPR